MTALSINKQQFEELLQGDKPLLVDYWAPWCGYCRRIESAYEMIAEEYGDDIVVAKVNIDDEPELAQQEKIEIIPTLAYYKNGQRMGSVIAPESKTAIEAFIAENRGAAEMNDDAHVYDMIIVGGGPGGYTAALYAARAGLDVMIIEKLSAGGQMAQTHQIDNYPGFVEGIEGFELAMQMQQQAERFGAHTEYAVVDSLDLRAEPKVIVSSAGTFYGKTVVLATGAGPKELGVAKESELVGRGVAYCATCDGMFYRGKNVIVVGGGNSAAEDALYLSRIANKVTLVHRRDSLRATKVYHKPLMETENVGFCWNSTVEELLHEAKLTGVRLKDVITGEESVIEADGLFVSIGRKPATELVKGQIDLDASGYIIAGEDTATNIPGVYAVGDVRTKRLRQVVTAVADGAVAVNMAEEYLADK